MDTPINKEERTWAMGAHLSAFAGHFVPFGHIIGPLVIWMIKKDSMPLVDDQGKEALNFQITMTIGFAACLAMAFTVILIPLAVPIGAVLWLVDVILTIIAAVKANDGVAYRYPLCLRLVK
jgi:uncharacterized protein